MKIITELTNLKKTFKKPLENGYKANEIKEPNSLKKIDGKKMCCYDKKCQHEIETLEEKLQSMNKLLNQAQLNIRYTLILYIHFPNVNFVKFY